MRTISSGGGGTPAPTGFEAFVTAVEGPLNALLLAMLAILGAAALIFAIWVGIRLAKAEDEGKRKEAKQQLLWSIIAVVAAVALAVLFGTIFGKDGIFTPGGKLSTNTGDSVRDAGNIVVNSINGAVGALLKIGAIAGIMFAVYLGIRLAMAQDEGKRKEAKQQLLWTIIAIVSALALQMIISGVMTILIKEAGGAGA